MSVFDNLSGIIPPIPTPLTEDRTLDEPALRRLVNHVIDGGCSGIFVMGSTGEFPFLDRDERKHIIRLAAEETAGRVPVLAGVSDAGTDLAVRNARDAEEAGADAAVATLPYYFATPQESAQIEHFRCIARSTGLPLALYNAPHTVKTALKAETVITLAQEGTAKAIKDSSSDFMEFQKMVFALGDKPGFRIFHGSEFLVGAAVLMGGHGGVLGMANLAPKICVQLYEAAARGDAAQTRELQQKLTEIGRVFYAGESVIGSLKAVLSILGLCSPITSIPIPAASEESMRRIEHIMADCGVI